jgi:hypothetical protein
VGTSNLELNVIIRSAGEQFISQLNAALKEFRAALVTIAPLQEELVASTAQLATATAAAAAAEERRQASLRRMAAAEAAAYAEEERRQAALRALVGAELAAYTEEERRQASLRGLAGAEAAAYIEEERRQAILRQLAGAEAAAYVEEERRQAALRQLAAAEAAAYVEEERRQAALRSLAGAEAAAFAEEERRQASLRGLAGAEAAAYVEEERRQAVLRGLAAAEAAAYVEEERRQTAMRGLAAAEAAAFVEEERRQAALRGLAGAEAAAYVEEERRIAQVRRMALLQAEAITMDERRTASLNAAAAGQAKFGQSVSSTIDILKSLLIISAVFKSFELFSDSIKEGFSFNSTIEQARLGIAALITAEADLKNAQGQTLTGAEALTVAHSLAADQIDKLRIAGLQTASTTKQLAAAFQQAIGVGLTWGLTLDQIREITIGVTQAAGALGVPMTQLNEEVRSLIAGTISIRNTRVATSLGITNADIKNAREMGNLAGFILDRIKAFNIAGEQVAKTWQGVTSNVKEALQVFAGDATKPLFDQVKVGLQTALEGVFDLNAAQVSDKFSTILGVSQEISQELGGALASGLRFVVREAEAFNDWLSKNRVDVQGIIDGVGILASTFGDLIGFAGTFAIEIDDVTIRMGLWKGTLELAAFLLSIMVETLQVLKIGALALGQVLAEALIQPIEGAVRVAGVLLGVVNDKLGDAFTHAADVMESRLQETRDEFTKTSQEFLNGGGAIDKFFARLEEGGKKEFNVPILQQLRQTTNAVIHEQGLQEQAEGSRLQRQLDTRKQYEEKIRDIRIKSINDQIEAINQAAGKVQGEDAQRALTNQILELQRQKKLLEQGNTISSRPLPENAKGAKEREAALKNQLEAEKKLVADEAKIAEERAQANASAFEGGLKVQLAAQQIAQSQFDKQRIDREQTLNDDLLKIRSQALEEQIKIQQRLVDATTDPSNKQREIGRLRELKSDQLKVIADYDKKRQDLELEDQQRAAALVVRLGEQGTKDQIQILRSRGHEVDAVRLEQQLQFGQRLKELQAQNTEEARQQAAAIQSVINSNINKAQFEEIRKTATQELDKLQNSLQETQQLSDIGQINSRQKQERVVDAYQHTREVIGQLLPELQALARDSGNQEMIQQVEELRLRYQQMGVTLSQLTNNILKLKAGFLDASEHGLEAFFNAAFEKLTSGNSEAEASVKSLQRSLASAQAEMNGLLAGPPTSDSTKRIDELRKQMRAMNDDLIEAKKNAQSWGDVFVQAIQAVVREMENLLARMAAVAILNAILGIFRGGGGENFGGVSPTLSGGPTGGGGIAHAATGGWVTGGVPNQDSVHILGMPEEFILRAPATRAIRRAFGPGWLEELNAMGGLDDPAPIPQRMRSHQNPIRMEGGGFVPAAPTSSTSSGELRGRVTLEHSEDVILRVVESDAGLDVQLRQFSKNRNAIRGVLGIG